MHYITTYFAFLREIYQDISGIFDVDAMEGFILAASILIPIFGTLFFFALLVSMA